MLILRFTLKKWNVGKSSKIPICFGILNALAGKAPLALTIGVLFFLPQLVSDYEQSLHVVVAYNVQHSKVYRIFSLAATVCSKIS